MITAQGQSLGLPTLWMVLISERLLLPVSCITIFLWKPYSVPSNISHLPHRCKSIPLHNVVHFVFLKHAELMSLPHKVLWLIVYMRWCVFTDKLLVGASTSGVIYDTAQQQGISYACLSRANNNSGNLDVLQMLCRYSSGNTGFSSGYSEQKDLCEQLRS